MTYVLLALVILGFGALQAQIGGMDSIGLAMPAYVLLAIAACISLFIRKMPSARPSPACLWSSALFFGYILIRALASPVPYLARQDIFMILAALIVYLLTAIFLVSSRARLLFCGALFVLLIANVAVGIVQFKNQDNFMLFGFGRADYGPRASGLFTVPNQLPGLLNVVAFLGFAMTLWGRIPTTPRLLIAYMSIVGLAGVIMSGSRGGYLAAGATLLVFALLCIYPLRKAYPHRFWRLMMVAAVVGTALIAVAIVGVQKSHYLTKRAKSVYDPQNMRVKLWQTSLQQFQLNPLFGTGSGTFRIYGRKFRDPSVQTDPIHVHNDYLELLAEYGAVGAVGFLIFLGSHLGAGLRAYRKTIRHNLSPHTTSNTLAFEIGALCAVSVYLVHSVVDFNLHIPSNALLMAFMFGVLANAGHRHSSRLKSTSPVPASWPKFVLPALGLFILVFGVRLWPGEYFTFQARMENDKREREKTLYYTNLALQWDDRNPFTYFYSAQAYGALGYRNRKQEDKGWEYYMHAVADYTEAARLFPDDVVTHANLAWSLDQMEDYKEAEKHWKIALALDPNFAEYLAYYGEHLGEMDHYYQAREYFTKSLALRSNEVAREGLEEMNHVIGLLEKETKPVDPGTAAAY